MDEAGALPLAGFDIGENPLKLTLADDGSHRGRRVGRRAGLEGSDLPNNLLNDALIDRIVHEGPAGRAARLATPGEIHAGYYRGRDPLQIGITKGDERILSAELQQSRLDAGGRRSHHGPTGGNASDQRHHGDIVVCDECAANVAVTRQYVEDAGGEQMANELGEPKR